MITIKGNKKELEKFFNELGNSDLHFQPGSISVYRGIRIYVEPSMEIEKEDLNLPKTVKDFIFAGPVESCLTNSSNEEKIKRLEEWIDWQEKEANGWYLDSYGNWQTNNT